MNRITAILTLAISLLGSTAVYAQQITLVEWNIRGFETKKKDAGAKLLVEDIREYVDLFKSANPDVLCLNEFQTGTSRIGRENMAELASRMNMFGYYIASYPNDTGYDGNAILSKYPIINSGSTYLEYVHVNGDGCYTLNSTPYLEIYGNYRRSVGYADILVPDCNGGSTIVRICCTHLEGLDRQANELLEFCSLRSPAYPSILAGDINAVRTSSCVSILEGAGEYLGGFYIDLAFGYPKGAWEVMEDTIISSTTAAGDELSDHQMIKMILKHK
ncbi:MAG: endonuclease/exonuclease/phosphatase family protein [Bacteroidales bacterium]|nr:endonuclease/exonuclease/phosphatase family protein [Bacteroidales bacterium]